MLEVPAAMLHVAGAPWLPSTGAHPISAMCLTARLRDTGQLCTVRNSSRAAASTNILGAEV